MLGRAQCRARTKLVGRVLVVLTIKRRETSAQRFAADWTHWTTVRVKGPPRYLQRFLRVACLNNRQMAVNVALPLIVRKFTRRAKNAFNRENRCFSLPLEFCLPLTLGIHSLYRTAPPRSTCHEASRNGCVRGLISVSRSQVVWARKIAPNHWKAAVQADLHSDG